MFINAQAVTGNVDFSVQGILILLVYVAGIVGLAFLIRLLIKLFKK